YDGQDTSKEAYQKQINEWIQRIDIADNVALAYSNQGNDWIKNEEWIYMDRALDEESPLNDHDQKIQDTANSVRQAVKDYIVPFTDQLEKGQTNREIAGRLYHFMQRIGVIEQLQLWQYQLIQQGELEEAREHEQAWNTFILLLDEFVEVLGDEEWDI